MAICQPATVTAVAVSGGSVLLRYLLSPDSFGSRIYFGFSDLGLPAVARASAAPGIQPARSAAAEPGRAAGRRAGGRRAAGGWAHHHSRARAQVRPKLLDSAHPGQRGVIQRIQQEYSEYGP